MALPATDSFTTGSPDKALTTYSANWTYNSGTFTVYAAEDNVESSSSDAETGAHWNADSFNADQYAQGTKATGTGASYGGVAVRAAASGATYYGFYYAISDSYMFRMVSGSWTQKGSTGGTIANASVVRLEVEGTSPATLTPKVGGTLYATIGTATDSSIASGYAGISGYGAGASVGSRLDNWEGGNLAAGPTYTLTCDAGSYTLTGQTTGLVVDRVLSLNAGSYTITGQAAGLVASRLIDLATGAYTITGQDAGLLRGYPLVCDAGTYTVTGQATGLVVSRLLGLDAGTYTVTGQAAGLIASRLIDLAAGAYTIIGQDPTLAAYTILRPNADGYVGSWTDELGGSTNIYLSIDEASPSDADYIQSETDPVTSPVVIGLASASDPQSSTGHVVRYRYGKSGTQQIDLVVQLRQGYVNEGSPGTLIAQWTHTDVSGTIALAEQTLSGAQADSISNYGDLFVRFTGDGV